MAGLTIDDAMPSIIDAKTHGLIDYIHAGTNFLAAALFRKNRRARNAALALGAGVLANALMTDYPLGVFRLYSFKVHGILDYGVATASAVLPALLGIENSAPTKYFRMQGAGETVIAGITDYDDDSGAVRQRGRLEKRFERRRAA
ncbi:MAG TPA: hypothetical protein VFA76_13410 [Terriglobales bacterium]|nr:hypothetical protein [Terriglobales bacterium]